ncbi:MAG: hypothetical protein Q9190_000330 [Brigantiaea leucoxantha]
MAATSSTAAESGSQALLLHVLSPSNEVPDKLTFRDLLPSTTLRELKQRIQNTVPSKPAPARQRLIYRGKPLIQEDLTLKDVFTQEMIDHSESLSLHLVLPPSAPPLPGAAASPVNNAPMQRDPRHNWSPPFATHPRARQNTPQPAQVQQESIGAGHHPTPTTTATGPEAQSNAAMPQAGPNPMMQGQFPPQIQNALNSFASLNQHIGTHLAQHGQHMHQMPFLPQGLPHNNHWQQTPFSQPSFQQIIAQQQQARAAAGQQGLSPRQNSPTPGAQRTGPTQSNDQARSENTSNPTAQLGNTSTVVRENQGPNGESWRMVIQSTSISRPSSGIGQRPVSHPPNQNTSQGPLGPDSGIGTSPGIAPAETPTAGNTSIVSPAPPQTSSPLLMFQQRLSSIETALWQGNAPAEGVFDHARAYLNNMASQPNAIPTGLEAPLRTRLNNLSMQADQLRTNLTSVLARIAAEQQSQPLIQHTAPQTSRNTMPTAGQPSSQLPIQPSSSADSSSASSQIPTASGMSSSSSEQPNTQQLQQPPTTSEVYLLSSPAGPYALLLSPSGLYGGILSPPAFPNFSNFLPTLNRPMAPQWAPITHNTHQPNPNPSAQTGQQQPPQAPAPANITLAHAQQAQQQQQQQQNNQARDLARILLPLGGHLWLLIRLFGFVYFFTAGGGQRRAILLGICAFLVFIAQTGIFRPLFQAIWDPVRRHAEGLLPLQPQQQVNQPNDQRPQRDAQGRVTNTPNSGNPNPAPAPNNDRDPNAPSAVAESATQSHNPALQNREPSPQQTADRLLRDQHERSLFRRAERAVALFVASLVPGVGERHIAARDAADAQRLAEEREREVQAQREREGEEERALEVEEVRRRESTAVAGVEDGASGVDGGIRSGRQQDRGDDGRNAQPLIET